MKKKTNVKWFVPYVLVSIWVVVHLVLSLNRAICVDEGAKHSYAFKPFWEALFLHMSEAAPYHPGEFTLGYLSHLLFGALPDELWARIPSIAFGALTLFLCFHWELPLLFLSLFFSVALTSFATEFLSYTPLMFGGALAWRMTLSPKPVLGPTWFWINLLFGHLYGICAVGLLSFFRRQWTRVALSALVVSGVLGVHLMIRRHHPPAGASLPPFLDLVRQTLGAFSNPHKALFFYTPLFIVGLAGSTGFFSKHRKFHPKRPALELFCVFFCLSFLPILASYAGDYPYLPRQALGAIVPFLGFSAIGAWWLSDRLKAHQVHRGLVVVGCLISAFTWSLYLKGKPPFVDQPLYRIHTLAKKIANEPKYQRVLWIGPATADAEVVYLRKHLGKETEVRRFNLQGFFFEQYCWRKRNLCFLSLKDNSLIWGGNDSATQGRMEKLVNQAFDAIVYSEYEKPKYLHRVRGDTFRAW